MAEDILKKTDQELQKALTEKREALRAFRFNVAGSKARNVKEGRDIRRTVARILTEINRRAKRAQ